MDLEANLMLLGAGKKEREGRLLLITLDALYAGPILTQQIRDGLKHLINPDSIVIGASHSHNAPMLDNTKPLLGGVEEGHLGRVIELILEGSLELFRRQREAGGVQVVARAKRYELHDSVSRRRALLPLVASRDSFEFFSVQMFPSKFGRRVQSEVVEFISDNGTVHGCIWVMPCHPVSHPDPTQLSSHFIGEVRAAFRQKREVSNYAAFCFFQGASGDLRPPAFVDIRHQSNTVDWWFKRVFQKPFYAGYGPFSKSGYSDWVMRVKSDFESARTSSTWQVSNSDSSVSCRRSSLPLSKYFSFEAEKGFSRRIEHQVFKIAGLTFIGISAEPTHDAGAKLRKGIQNSTVIGCISDTFGYLTSPVQEVLGGYESRGFESSFSLKRLCRRSSLLESLSGLWNSRKQLDRISRFR